MMVDEFDKMADEAEAFSYRLRTQKNLEPELIIDGLNNQYDVIVAECIDYAIMSGRTEEFISKIWTAAERVDSYFVWGRVRLAVALAKDAKLRDSLSRRGLTSDIYYKAWDYAAQYIETRDSNYLNELSNLSHYKDKTVASLAQHLKDLIS